MAKKEVHQKITRSKDTDLIAEWHKINTQKNELIALESSLRLELFEQIFNAKIVDKTQFRELPDGSILKGRIGESVNIIADEKDIKNALRGLDRNSKKHLFPQARRFSKQEFKKLSPENKKIINALLKRDTGKPTVNLEEKTEPEQG